MAAQEFLRQQGLQPPEGAAWSQGHILMYLPEFQQAMQARGIPEEVFQPYQVPGLAEVVSQAPPRDRAGNVLTPEQVHANIQLFMPGLPHELTRLAQ